MCGSRKYSYPPPGRFLCSSIKYPYPQEIPIPSVGGLQVWIFSETAHWKFQRGGVLKAKIFKGM